MNSPTQHYVKLRESLKKAEVITRGIDRRECKTELQHLKLQAYVLLCHSALEEYIEDLGLSVAQQARSLFSNSGLITRALVALISSRLVDELSEKGKRRVTSELTTNIDQFSQEAFNRYRDAVAANNGIVARDQRRILIPIGVDPEAVDVVLMNAMHTFGARRGDVAHKFKVQRADTLSAVATDLSAILVGLLAYDAAACDAIAQRLTVAP